MTRIEDTFARCREAGRAAFMPYLVAGDPDMEATARLIIAFAEAGADLIELGVPFSDPMADGPTNQRAAERALLSGTTLRGILEMVKSIRASVSIPINLMGYYNPFFHYGLERFFQDAADAGVDGLIVPDLQPDDAAEVRDLADAAGVATIFLIAPTSTPARLARVAQESRGFVYAVSLSGVTGERTSLPPDLTAFVDRAKATIPLPLAVGFGISTPAMAQGVADVADGVIVGSAIVKRIEAAVEAGRDPVSETVPFLQSMVEACQKSKGRPTCNPAS